MNTTHLLNTFLSVKIYISFRTGFFVVVKHHPRTQQNPEKGRTERGMEGTGC